ncbi:STAS domain-containing protein [Nocardia amikacinitolerans]|uniref:STAS domain-containing protein n=1 Tax=Nocardia amikacinitolerans TaxID=756689 RepID=UPI0020A3BBE6|nr:STAS domain-containing protein [Nocardia amikacinitolerans]MCP2290662.1 anti-anti-sigma factor [Nocardia amikacinitolerans]
MDAPHAVGESERTVPLSAELAVSPLLDRPGVRASGEITAVTRSSWEDALAELARRHTNVSYVDLSNVAYIDVSGTTALAVTAMSLPVGRVVVENPPSSLSRVLEMFWPNLNRIEVTPR